MNNGYMLTTCQKHCDDTRITLTSVPLQAVHKDTFTDFTDFSDFSRTRRVGDDIRRAVQVEFSVNLITDPSPLLCIFTGCILFIINDNNHHIYHTIICIAPITWKKNVGATMKRKIKIV